MVKVIKWGAIIFGVFILLVIAAIIIIPMVVDVQKYKPEIEKRVAEATGRPFAMGGDLELSLFPWVGASLSDVHLGNPPGFREKDFVSVKSFEVRVKLLPLLSKDIQVKRFVLQGPRIVLEKTREGRGNWEGIGKRAGKAPPKEAGKAPEAKTQEGLPVKALTVGEFSISDGTVIWIDHAKDQRQEIQDVTLKLNDVSLDRPLRLFLSARLDGKPLSLEGEIGPVGRDPGKGTIPLDIAIRALKQLEASVKGKLVDPAIEPRFDLALQVSRFSPREVMTALGQAFPVATTDPKALNAIAMKAHIQGNPQELTIKDGTLDLDDSHLNFFVKAREFEKPNVSFKLELDQIDLDRYMPPPEAKPAGEKGKGEPKAPAQSTKKPDYGPLRKLVVDGSIRIDKLKARGAEAQDLNLKVSGKDGVFQMDPFGVKLYEGVANGKGSLDVRQAAPRTALKLLAEGIQVGPLLRDFMKKDFLEGTMRAQVALRLEGDEADAVKRSLNGQGELHFTDGAIKGIDLAGMVRNVKATFGLAQKAAERPKTDFSELRSPFTLTNGLFNTPGTTMQSPLLRILASGDADLVKETLDLRVEPKFVATLKGQGDQFQRAGVMVPVLVGGTFSSPTFRPDLKEIITQTVKGRIPIPKAPELENVIPKRPALEKMIPGQGQQKEESGTLEEKAKGLIKSLPLGQ